MKIVEFLVFNFLAGYVLGNLALLAWHWIDRGEKLKEQPWHKKAVAFLFWPIFTIDVLQVLQADDYATRPVFVRYLQPKNYLFLMTLLGFFPSAAWHIVIWAVQAAVGIIIIAWKVLMFLRVFTPPWIKK